MPTCSFSSCDFLHPDDESMCALRGVPRSRWPDPWTPDHNTRLQRIEGQVREVQLQQPEIQSTKAGSAARFLGEDVGTLVRGAGHYGRNHKFRHSSPRGAGPVEAPDSHRR